jgi:hypothetical protein
MKYFEETKDIVLNLENQRGNTDVRQSLYEIKHEYDS